MKRDARSFLLSPSGNVGSSGQGLVLVAHPLTAPHTSTKRGDMDTKGETMIELPARDLQVGDYIKTEKGRAVIHTLPRDRSTPFKARWMIGNQATGETPFDPDEVVTVYKRWPDGFPALGEKPK